MEEAMPSKTDSTNQTIWIEDGEEVYPCRCGETHRGDYALYTVMHHEHDHDEVFWDIADIGICTGCGKTIIVIDGRDV
jgi:CDGSH-type Zn-finger protein